MTRKLTCHISIVKRRNPPFPYTSKLYTPQSIEGEVFYYCKQKKVDSDVVKTLPLDLNSIPSKVQFVGTLSYEVPKDGFTPHSNTFG